MLSIMLLHEEEMEVERRFEETNGGEHRPPDGDVASIWRSVLALHVNQPFTRLIIANIKSRASIIQISRISISERH